MNAETKVDVYGIATSHILHYLNRGIIPWHISWITAGVPRSLQTGLEYRGLNVFLLAALGYPKNLFLNPKQVDELGGTVKKGQKPDPVFYWRWNQSGENQRDQQSAIFRYSYVYNISQCDGIKKSMVPKVEKPKHPFVVALSTISHMRRLPTISHGLQPACYMPTLDCIDLPKKESFASDEGYFSSLFRCLIHSTGHESRLNRNEIMKSFVTNEGRYCIAEELIGDIGAAQLANIAGIKYVPASHSENDILIWIESLLNDSHLIVYASAQAQKAVDYILNQTK